MAGEGTSFILSARIAGSPAAVWLLITGFWVDFALWVDAGTWVD